MTKRRGVAAYFLACFAVVTVLLGALSVVASRQDRQHQAAAKLALPQAEAYLASDPKYKTVRVALSPPDDGYLWFSGSLPTQAECDVLENEIEKRFGQLNLELRYTVLSRYEDEYRP